MIQNEVIIPASARDDFATKGYTMLPQFYDAQRDVGADPGRYPGYSGAAVPQIRGRCTDGHILERDDQGLSGADRQEPRLGRPRSMMRSSKFLLSCSSSPRR